MQGQAGRNEDLKMKLALKLWLPGLTIIAIGMAVYLVLSWSVISILQRLFFSLALVLVLHMHEEEKFPGGFGYVFNVVRARSTVPDRYPMNPLIAMVVDLACFFLLFTPALLFPHVVWLTALPMFLACMEFVVHASLGIVQRRRLGYSIYNPGLVTAAIMGTIGVTYFYNVASEHLFTGFDWLRAVLYFVATVLIGLVLPEQGLKSRDSQWPYEREHFLGFYERYTTIAEVFGEPALPDMRKRR